MEFRILGPLQVFGPRGRIKIGGPLPRAVLALLVMNVGKTVTGDRLIDEIWGDDPPRGAQHALEVHVAALRRALGPGWIERQPEGYRLRSAGSEVDVERFELLTGDASRAIERGEPQAAATALAAAIGLWRGPPFGISRRAMPPELSGRGSTSFVRSRSSGESMLSLPAAIISPSSPSCAGSSPKCSARWRFRLA